MKAVFIAYKESWYRNSGQGSTSAATVAVLPEAEELDIKIDEKDLRIDVFRSSGQVVKV